MDGVCPKWHISLISGHGADDPRATRETVQRETGMIGILIFPDFQLLDAAGPISVFEIAGRFAKATLPIKVMAAEPGAIRSSSGVEMLAKKFGSPNAITTLIIAG